MCPRCTDPLPSTGVCHCGYQAGCNCGCVANGMAERQQRDIQYEQLLSGRQAQRINALRAPCP